MSVDGKPQTNYGLRDTVDVPPTRRHGHPYPGRTVVHCHVLDHEDAGMMAVLQIEK